MAEGLCEEKKKFLLFLNLVSRRAGLWETKEFGSRYVRSQTREDKNLARKERLILPRRELEYTYAVFAILRDRWHPLSGARLNEIAAMFAFRRKPRRRAG